jgi:tetratricopeptide (TPR) repeat protein
MKVENQRSLVGCLLAFVVMAAPERAGATEPVALPTDQQMAAARSFFDNGQALYKQGKYESAWLEFSSAYQIAPLPDLLFNMARCEAKIGRREDAVRHYRQFLERVPNDPEADKIRAQIAELEAQIQASGGTQGGASASAPGGAGTPSESRLRKIPLIATSLGGGAVVLLIAGAGTLGYVGSEYGALSERCNRACDPMEWAGLRSTSHAGYALLGLSAAAAVAAAAVLPWELKKMRAERKLALSVGLGSLGLAGRF